MVGRSPAAVVAVDGLFACFGDDGAEVLRCYRSMVVLLVEPSSAWLPLVAGEDVFVVGRFVCVPWGSGFTWAMVWLSRPMFEVLVGSVDGCEGVVAARRGRGCGLRRIVTYLGCSVMSVDRRV